MPHPLRSRDRDRGQAAIEFAITFPLVVIVLLAVAQFAIVVGDQLAVQLAAREGARAASVSAGTAGAVEAAQRATAVSNIEITVTDNGSTVTVTATKSDVATLPIVGLAIGDLVLTSSVTMAVEPATP